MPSIGSAGQVPFVNAGSNDLAYDSRIFWDSTNGRLGIGTPTPQRRLHLVGQIARFRSGNTNDAAIEISAPNNDSNVVMSLRGTDANNALIANDAIGNIYLRPQGQGVATGELYLTSDGRVRANYDGSESTPTYGFTGDNDTGMYRAGTDILGIASGGSAVFAFTPAAAISYTRLALQGSLSDPVLSNANPQIYRTATGGSGVYPFNSFGNLVIQARSNSGNHIAFVTGTSSPAARLSVLSSGVVRVESGATLEVMDTLIIPVK